MSTDQDIEAGLSEARDLLQPLLGGRPRTLGPLNTTQNQSWIDLPSASDDLTPSIASTANNTPLSEVPDSKLRRRGDRRLRRLNTELLEAIETNDVVEVERLLNAGANPNATCTLGLVSACHIAALKNGDALSLLLRFGAEKHRLDKLGRTPLHLAAWAGHARQMAILLNLPEDMQSRVDCDSMSSEAEEDVRRLCPLTKALANVRCDLREVQTKLPKTWRDNIDHACKDIIGSLPVIQPGWTPLHVATACTRYHCARLLLAAGGDPNICDEVGRTALDVVGFAYYYDGDIDSERFTAIIKMLLKAGAQFNLMKAKGLDNMDTPLHTAVELHNMDAINELLNAGACVASLNSSGFTPLHVCVKKEFEDPLQVLANHGSSDTDPLSAIVDVRDSAGRTVLQLAVATAWFTGVCTALEAGADVTLKANNGETPIHTAAALGNTSVLNEILSMKSVSSKKDFIDCQNDAGETPLFTAIVHGHLDCVTALLNEGANMKITQPGDINVLHVAAELGHHEILNYLLDYNDAVTNALINILSNMDKKGVGPIHCAVSKNHPKCVKLLLAKNADIRLRTLATSPYKSSTPLHIAAVKNHAEIAKILLETDKTIIHEVNGLGWFPLHSAGHHGSRDVIPLLLREGADLSGYTDGPKKFRKTAIDYIINNLSKPTDFLEEVFDSYISTNNLSIQDTGCEITVDHRILMPSTCEMEQMKVIQALIKTGNRCGQKRLLVHPLVESFLYLKWKALLPFFYTMIALYAMFVMSLTIFAVSVFFYKDTGENPPKWLSPHIWGNVVYVTMSLLALQEILCMDIKLSKLETWIKFGSIALAAALPPAVMITSLRTPTCDWPRHLATIAILLSWVELMILLSRFPNWGYYVLMFWKVAANVIKILFTFAFLVIGFSLAFMIQFRSQIPFEGPWAAFVKTMVMMTSEFDYVALFDEEHSKDLATSLIVIRVMFVIFLVLAAIVLMNLMVGVAVNDINDLEILGNIKRLAKQVEYLGTLDTLVYNRVFTAILPRRINESIKRKRNVTGVLKLCPGKARWRIEKVLPTKLRDAILDKALMQKKQKDSKISLATFKKKLDEMHSAIIQGTKQDEKSDDDKTDSHEFKNIVRDDVAKDLNRIDKDVDKLKSLMFTKVEEPEMEQLNNKINQMSLDIEVIKQFLSKMESHLSTLGKTNAE